MILRDYMYNERSIFETAIMRIEVFRLGPIQEVIKFLSSLEKLYNNLYYLEIKGAIPDYRRTIDEFLWRNPLRILHVNVQSPG